ncbi:MAG: hypothetical protein JEZ09_18365 [Salinivirgaceae bacterium]|nr:hypothetical protein [Salinivirgaceae bacterium]
MSAINKYFEHKAKRSAVAREDANTYFEDFNDSLAEQIEWDSIGASSVFKMHTLIENSSTRIEFRISNTHKIIWRIIAVIGILVLLSHIFIDFGYQNSKSNPNALLYMGILLVTIGILIPSQIKKKVFDKSLGYFWVGKMPNFDKYTKEPTGKLVKITDIHALQFIRVNSNNENDANKPVFRYELNLVLNSLNRIHISSDFNGRRILHEGEVLKKFLAVPLWNVVS